MICGTKYHLFYSANQMFVSSEHCPRPPMIQETIHSLDYSYLYVLFIECPIQWAVNLAVDGVHS